MASPASETFLDMTERNFWFVRKTRKCFPVSSRAVLMHMYSIFTEGPGADPLKILRAQHLYLVLGACQKVWIWTSKLLD